MKPPKGWSHRSIADFADVVGGIQKGPHREPGANAVRYLTVAHVQRNRVFTDDPRFFEVTANELARWRLEPQDVLIIEGNGSADQIGRTALFRGDIPDCVHQNHVIRVRVDHAKASAQYLNAFLNSSIGQTTVQNLSMSSSGLRTLSVGRIREIPVPFPPLPEQRKIAEILTTWDEALEKLDALIAAQDRRKQGLMQQLLARASARRRRGHAQHRLGDLVDRVTRRNNAGDTNVLTISAQDGLVSQRDYFNRSVASTDLSGYYHLLRGEFAYNRSAAKGYPYGAIKRLEVYDSGVVSTLYLCFAIKDGAPVDSDYLVQYMESGRLNAGLRAIAKEGARAHGLLNVTADEFMDIDLLLPPPDEQRRIAEILATSDEELRLLRAQRTALDQQKRGLMQRLLTGRVRVKTSGSKYRG